MRTEFADEPPDIELRGGLAYLIYAGESRPAIAVPIHVLRRFCESGIRKLNAHDAQQSNVVVQLRSRQSRGPPLPHG